MSKVESLFHASISKKSAILPVSLPPRGLSREIAAAYIGIGSTKFDEMVNDGLMPKPKVLGARRLWDRSEIDTAFSVLPHVGDTPATNPWDDI